MNTVYLSHPDFEKELLDELQDISAVQGNLVFSSVDKTTSFFALDIWHDVQIVKFNSISEAAKILRAENKFWLMNPIENVRRATLIAAELRKLPVLQHEFPIVDTIPLIGCFSLLDANTLVFSKHRWKKPPLGLFHFIEDKKTPPNRAYLKLWEALSLLEKYPEKNHVVIDLGASPGGWTYVMQSLGCVVHAYDKAPLDSNIAKLPNVHFHQQSAFSLEPDEFEQIDWLLSDVACYPERAYELVTKWIDSNKAKRIIFTIKLQGETDFEILEKFAAIPNSFVAHLFYNKHEVTFFYMSP